MLMLGVTQRHWWPLEHVAVLCLGLGPGPDWCKLPGPGLLLAGNWAPLTGTATTTTGLLLLLPCAG